MTISFTRAGWAEYQHWVMTDPKLRSRIDELIKDVTRSPFRGIGKPEPLRENWKGWWSRRIDDEHRLIYRVTATGDDQRLEIAQSRYHY